ncbi:MAG: hypothetical protein P8P99_02475 [Maricaulis sp.]|nr:hypothetical protein [Maricaulis sp.]
MPIVSMDMGVLASWYQARNDLSYASQAALAGSRDSQLASKNAVIAPWDVRGEVSKLEDMRRSVLATGVFFSDKTSEFSRIDAPQEHKDLFDMYQGLKRMLSVAEEAKDKTTSDSQRRFLNSRLQGGVSQLSTFYDTLDMTEALLLKGDKLSKAESDVTISRGKSEYVTGTVHTGDFDAEVASLTGDVQFNIAVKKNGVTTNIAINLADMGATVRNLDNISAHINTELDAAGMLTTFSRGKVGEKDETGVIPGADYGFKVSGISTEEVSFSASGGSAAIYLAGTSGLGDKAGGQIVKLTDVDSASPTTAYAVRYDADPDTETVEVNELLKDEEGAEARTVDSPNPLEIKSSVTAADGSLLVVGLTTASTDGISIKGEQDMVLAKYDSTGKQLWSRVLGSSGDAEGTSIALDDSGDIVVAGKVEGVLGTTSDIGGTDSFVAKYDANGVEQWLQRYGGTGDDKTTSVAVATDGTVYVAGDAKTALGGEAHLGGATDGYLRAIDSDGKTLYTRRVGSTGDETISSISVASDGALIVASQEDGNAVIRKFASGDGSSAAIWEQNLGNLEAGRIGDIAVDGTDIYIAGSAGSTFAPSAAIVANSGGERDAFLVKLTDGASATVDYTTFLGSDKDETANSITVSGGKVYLGGKTTGDLPGQTAVGERDAFAAAFTASSGALDWVTQIGGREGVNETTGISVVAGGDSILDSLGLPAGKLAYADSRVVTDRSSARTGDHFYISVDGGRRKKITIDGDDTMRALTFKINAALVLDGNADVRRASAGDMLRITPKEGTRIELFAGSEGQDLLKSLGVTAGSIINTPSLLDDSASSDAPKIFAMGLPTSFDLTDYKSAEKAYEAIEAAMAVVQRTFREITTSDALKELTSGKPGKTGGTVPAYLTAQIANYSAGLERLGGGGGAFF